jgi:hypothetical protein
MCTYEYPIRIADDGAVATDNGDPFFPVLPLVCPVGGLPNMR